RRPRPDDYQVERLAALRPRGVNRVDGLSPLLQRIADETHAAELTGDEYARHAGLEVRREHRDIRTAPFGAEHQGDRLHGAGGLAGAMADAIRRAHELRATPDDAEHVMVRLFGARLHTRPAADAARRIDDRMERGGVVEPGGARALVRIGALFFETGAPAQEPRQQGKRRQAVGEIDQIVHAGRMPVTSVTDRFTLAMFRCKS